MRGGDERSGAPFSYVDLEAPVGKDHPLRTIRAVVNETLALLSSEFSALYVRMGRPSIPPEKLLRAMLLQALRSIRSERQLMERLEFDLVFRWFVGVGVDDAVGDHSTFSKNRERLLKGDLAAKLLSAVPAQPRVKRLLSTDHFSVDGTLIEAWASMKSFRPKDGEPPAGSGRNRDRSRSAALPQGAGQGGQALLHGAKRPCLCDPGGRPCRTDRGAARDRARPTPITLGTDKAYNADDFVNELRSMNPTPHVAQNTNGRSSAIDGRTTRHAGYAVSQRVRKRIEEGFGWIKTVAGQERTKFRGRERVRWAFTFAAAAYNLARLPKLLETSA
jgi:transposase